MMTSPRKMTQTRRGQASLMIDAFRMLERDLHWSLLKLQHVPAEWDHIALDNPPSHPVKRRVTAAFDADVVKYFKGLGPGYQARMNLVLRAYMHGRLAKILDGPDTTDFILHPERLPEWPENIRWGDSEREALQGTGTPGDGADAGS